ERPDNGGCRSRHPAAAAHRPPHPSGPGPLCGSVHRLQPDPLLGAVRRPGRAARRRCPRHAHHGRSAAGGHRLGRRPRPSHLLLRPLHQTGGGTRRRHRCGGEVLSRSHRRGRRPGHHRHRRGVGGREGAWCGAGRGRSRAPRV
ncbi:MAG: (3R)-hydroxyacyl-ACP dehydratase subunit HadB, partial [uncultured Propionibacteriaceae bacterium]